MNRLVWIAIALLTAYTCFMAGRTYEAYQYAQEREQEQREVLKKKIKKHGSGHHYLIEKGKLYMVKDVRDLENRKKWIRI